MNALAPLKRPDGSTFRPWMQTASGIAFDLVTPDINGVHFPDIFKALSHLNRWAGHTRFPYSVAQHSCLVHDILLRDYEQDSVLLLHALLHDAHEAYINDITTPTQMALEVRFPGVRGAIEKMKEDLDEVIFARAGISYAYLMKGHGELVKHADQVALTTEAKQLLTWRKDTPQWLAHYPAPISQLIPSIDAETAASWMKKRFDHLQERIRPARNGDE